MSSCCVKDCKNGTHAKEMCHKHYARYVRHGDPCYINPKCNRDGKAKERKYQKVKEWKKRNWEYYKAYLEARRMRYKIATPKWVNLREIESFYLNRPIGYHVDHISPLNGENSSGLHVIWNLQYLPAAENLKKRNKA